MAGPELFHKIVSSPGERAARHLLILHGILGQGRNWYTIAKELVSLREEWSVVLVDLRMHGRSQGFPPPHTVAACAGDLSALARSLPLPVAAVAGHSFGGKVALALAERATGGLEQVFVLDASPAAGPPATGIAGVMASLASIPMPQPSRDALVAQLVDRGLAERTARWVATNARSNGKEVWWRVDLGAIRAMLEDFLRRDFRPFLSRTDRTVAVRLVKAAESPVISASMLAYLEKLPEASRVTVDVLPGAGHWLHTDNPGGLMAILLKYL